MRWARRAWQLGARQEQPSCPRGSWPGGAAGRGPGTHTVWLASFPSAMAKFAGPRLPLVMKELVCTQSSVYEIQRVTSTGFLAEVVASCCGPGRAGGAPPPRAGLGLPSQSHCPGPGGCSSHQTMPGDSPTLHPVRGGLGCAVRAGPSAWTLSLP